MAKRRKTTVKKAAYIKWCLINLDMFQDQIAAANDVNPGRVSEIKAGKRFAGISPEKPDWAA